jgi:hypothetical protein
MKKLGEEGFDKEQIRRMGFIERVIPSNPTGLNEILFELEKLVIKTDDWDKSSDLDNELGRMSDYSAKRKVRQMWGTILHKKAFQYLQEKLEDSGWKLKYGQMIDGKEYDCIGWKGKKPDVQHLDLAIEMHFPMPKEGESCEFPYVVEQTRKMREKLKRINSKLKFLLVGFQPNKRITTLEIAHTEMKIFYQRYKYGHIKLLKQRRLDRY